MKYLDIPMQHGSDKVLQMMNKRSSRAQMIDVCRRLRERVPGLVIRTSLIVGFPGETDDDFEELLSFIDIVRPQCAGVFEFSATDCCESPSWGAGSLGHGAALPGRGRGFTGARLHRGAGLLGHGAAALPGRGRGFAGAGRGSIGARRGSTRARRVLTGYAPAGVGATLGYGRPRRGFPR